MITHLAFHQASQWEVIKQVGEVAPYICVAVLSQALVIEPVPAQETTE